MADVFAVDLLKIRAFCDVTPCTGWVVPSVWEDLCAFVVGMKQTFVLLDRKDVKSKGTSKVHPITGHEAPEGE
jgi:hypothetical protein